MNPDPRGRLLGVDGGGTSTEAWLADGDGRTIGRGAAGPSNIRAVGLDAALENLGSAIRSAFHDAGLDRTPVGVACLGLAGADRPGEKRQLGAWAEDVQLARRLLLVNDGDLVVAAGTPEGWGVGLISGTGSIAVGRARDGRTARAGGWGHLFGDEGSAYNIAAAGLRLLARRLDGRSRGPSPDPLARELARALGIDRPEGLIGAVYAPGFDRAKVAGLAPSVVLAASEDDAIGTEILEPAGRELGEMVAAVARALGFGPGPLPLALAGGLVLNAPAVVDALVRHLSGMDIEARVGPVAEPAAGALALALRSSKS